MRKGLDLLYLGTAWAGALFMVGVLLMVLASVLGRLLDFNLRGSDAYAGYCMAAAAFLAAAHTLKRDEHIRVTLFLERFGPRVTHGLEIWCHAAGAVFCALFAIFSVRLAWQSYTFHDISQGNDATPLWIPQIAMAAGACVLLVAMVDDFVLHLRNRAPRRHAAEASLKLME
jgi:TRAP-type C4-dicarboxylate transport system permease small subunit